MKQTKHNTKIIANLKEKQTNIQTRQKLESVYLYYEEDRSFSQCPNDTTDWSYEPVVGRKLNNKTNK
jgi:hypothetical protein